MELLEEKIDQMKQDIAKEVTERAMSIVEEPLVHKTTERVIDYLKEKEDKERRRKNLVIYNIPEPARETESENNDEGIAFCSNIIENSLVLDNNQYNISGAKRLGKSETEGRNRPVQLEEEKEKMEYTKQCKINERWKIHLLEKWEEPLTSLGKNGS